MSATVRERIKRVAKVSAISALTSAVAMLGSPVAAALAVVVIVLILALCWVLKDRDRSDHLTKVIYAWNGMTAPQPAENLDPAKPKSPALH